MCYNEVTTSGKPLGFVYSKGGFMKEKIIEAIGNKLDNLGVSIYDVTYGKVDGENTLTIILDRDEVININDTSSHNYFINVNNFIPI